MAFGYPGLEPRSMGFSKKTAKGRLDKYYFLAKDQGYRARSAFKLMQLNKKYALLEQARVAVDLCAAPGGWLQVAAKYMPAGRVIVGVDLVPIRPIEDVSTIVADITTERCRTELKKVLKGWKADVVLHDGAPNVGKAWVHDAYSQAELVLHSLRLATELLVRGGSFVTKVFRSKDYNALMWVFGQLFDRVEATKPASSRDVSAEIFVVCRGYRAPERIDPRLLDPRSVFAEVTPARSGDGARVDLEHPEKAARHRSGYEDGVTVLYKEAPVQSFVEASDPNALLATHNRLVFSPDTDERIIALADAPSNKDDIRALCADLKVLGFREFKILSKWRMRARAALSLDAAKVQEVSSSEVVTTEALELPEEDPLDELDEMARRVKRSEKKERAKALERKAKQRIRMQADMGHATDLAQDGLVSDRLFSLTSKAIAGDSESEDAPAPNDESGSDDSDYHAMLDSQFEEFHALRKGRERMRRDLEEHVRAEHAAAHDRVATDTEDVLARDHNAASPLESDAEDLPDFSNLRNTLQTSEEHRREADAKIEMWYANPLFRELDMATSAGVKRVADMGDAALESSTKKLAKLKKASAPKAAPAPAEGEIELVPAERRDVDNGESSSDESLDDSEALSDYDTVRGQAEVSEETKKAVLTPEGMSLAAKLTRDARRTLKEMVDDSFNRRATGDDEADLPRWFLDDEAEHNKPHKQVTKEGMALLRAKQAELDARPIKKVLEARGRNRRRAEKKIDALRQRAAAIADAEDIGERQKAEQIQRLMAKGLRPQRKEKHLVVARGVNRGLKGRPKGVKGHYKMVDSRLKKDLRAQKQARSRKAGRR